MPFWTPYAQEAPMDLSMASTQEAQKSVSPDVEPSAFYSPFEGYLNPYRHYGYELQQTRYVYPYPPPRPAAEHTVPLLHVSPESVGSASSVPRSAASSSVFNFNDSERLSDDEEYKTFENAAFETLKRKNGGSLLGTNPRMRRAVQTSQAADDSYKKQRQKNNLAAKQSRDRRKIREMTLSCQVTYLKQKLADLQARQAGRCERCGQPT